MNKKMIVVDLDVTLLNINQGCSRKAKKYLKQLKDLGYIIVIATGRTLKSAMDSTDGADFANYIIASTGAVLYDRDNFKILMKRSIDIDDVKNICASYNEDVKYIEFGDLYYYHKYMYDGKFNMSVDKKVNDIDEFLDNCEDIFHITFKVRDNCLINKYYDLLNRDSLSILVMQDSFSDEKCLEIFGNGTSKYNAINEVMNRENITSEDVISFGDGLNDVDMIRMCGIGVAMGNALEEVKAVSNYVTVSHNDDGVIYFLKKYLNENKFS